MSANRLSRFGIEGGGLAAVFTQRPRLLQQLRLFLLLQEEHFALPQRSFLLVDGEIIPLCTRVRSEQCRKLGSRAKVRVYHFLLAQLLG